MRNSQLLTLPVADAADATPTAATAAAAAAAAEAVEPSVVLPHDPRQTDHSRSHFFLLRRSDQLRNSELLAVPASEDADVEGSQPLVLLPHDPSVKLQSVTAFKRHVVVFERVKGLQRIRSIPLRSDGSPAPEAAKLVEFDEASYEIRALRSRFDPPRNVLPHTPSTTPSPCFAFNRVEFDEAAYEIRVLRSRFESPLLRYSFSSLVTPTTVFERDMDTDRQAARKVDWSPLLRFSFSSLVTTTTVFERDMDTDRQAARKVDWLGPSFDPSLYSSRRLFATAADGTQVSPSFDPSLYSSRRHFATAADGTQVGPSFDPSLYSSRRLFATAKDGTQVSISLVHRNTPANVAGAPSVSTDAAACSGPPWPMLLYAYGAYEVPSRLSFSPDRLSLLDRGMAVAVAHVRGGGDWDYQWYLDGKLLRKRNTVWDVIACAEHLIKEG
ncbi:unnamed protein product [Closterium sp. Naga37s-1]|nr:unnamed protein product [Closterium sp. Naga37s-1]